MQQTLALTAFLGFVSGIALVSVAPVPPAVVGYVALLSVGFFMAWFFGRRDVYLIPTLFLLLLALGAGRMLLAPRTLPEAFRPLLDTPVSLTGTVIADPDMRETNQRVTVAIQDGKAKPRYSRSLSGIRKFVGDEVSISGTLTTPEPFATDGGRSFEYGMYLAKDGVMALVPHAHIEITGTSSNIFLRGMRVLFNAKHAFTRALEDALSEPYASLAEGLITGGKQGLGSLLLDAFTVAGLLPIVVSLATTS
jgi:hypothetical protein